MEFTVGGHEYKSKKMDTFKQFHTGRRLLPILTSLKDVFMKLQAGSLPDNDTMLQIAFVPFCNAMAQMTDEDSEYVLNACLDVTKIKHAGAWANVRISGHTMFEFIDLSALLQIAFYILQDNFAHFLLGKPETATQATPA